MIERPRWLAALRNALDDLGLECLTVLYPGDRHHDLARRVTVVPLSKLATAEASAVIPGPGSRRRGGSA